jgi:hypothetical protein
VVRGVFKSSRQIPKNLKQREKHERSNIMDFSYIGNTMKISIDDQLVRLFLAEPEEWNERVETTDPKYALLLSWSSLLVFLEKEQLFEQLPPFEDTKLFTATVETLGKEMSEENLFYIYDSLFADILNKVRNCPEVNPSYLLHEIEKRKKRKIPEKLELLIQPALEAKEQFLRESPAHAMHGLILYLSWDRMCIAISKLFDTQSTNPHFLKNLKVLKSCLIESFLHIFKEGRVVPSLYRLVEALFFYQMREEQLQLHTEKEWEILKGSFSVLKGEKELVDTSYIDQALFGPPHKGQERLCHWTPEAPETVQRRMSLVQYVIELLKNETPDWGLELVPCTFVYFR